jgi:hypothetical protein
MGNFERQVPISHGLRRVDDGLFLGYANVCTGEDAFQLSPLVPTTPPLGRLLERNAFHGRTGKHIQSLFMCSRTWTQSFGCKAKSPASVGV